MMTSLSSSQHALSPPLDGVTDTLRDGPALVPGVRIGRRQLVSALTAGAIVVLLAHAFALLAAGWRSNGLSSYFVGDLPGYVRMLHLDGEHNVPAQFAALLLLLNAALFLAWSRLRVARAPLFWLLCAVAFAFLAVDELFELHERLGTILRQGGGFTGVLYYAWILPYAAGTLVLAGLALPALLRLPRVVQWRLIAAAAVYLAGAIGMEMIGGYLLTETVQDRSSLGYLICITLEEALELAGLVLPANAVAHGVPPARELELRLGPSSAALR
jgi:hypothetical protein